MKNAFHGPCFLERPSTIARVSGSEKTNKQPSDTDTFLAHLYFQDEDSPEAALGPPKVSEHGSLLEPKFIL